MTSLYRAYPSVVFVLAMAATAGRAAAAESVGNDMSLGAFRVSLEFGTNRLKVTELTQTKTPFATLVAELIEWNSSARVVRLNVAIVNVGTKSLVAPRAVVRRLLPSGTTPLNHDSGSGPRSWSWNYPGALVPTTSTQPREWIVRSQPGADLHLEILVIGGVPLAPGEGATISGSGATRITIAPGSLEYEALVDIDAVPAAVVTAPTGALEVVGAVQVTLLPAVHGHQELRPSVPLTVTVPAPGPMSTGHFIVAQEVVLPALGDAPGLRPQLVPVDTAVLNGAEISTTGAVFDGVRGPGTYVFLANHGSGYVTGTVTQNGIARRGVVVSNDTNTLVATTSASGSYTLYVNGGPFTVTGFDPLRGTGGTASGTIVTSGSTVTRALSLTRLPDPANVLDGIRNGGFEEGTLGAFWVDTGAGAAIAQLGPTSTGVIIRPTEGAYMAAINTGEASVGGIGSSIRQRFRVPAGVRTLRVDYNFVSEEFPEFVGSQFDDSFRAVVNVLDGNPNPEITFATVSVNQSGGFQLIGDCLFPGGDRTCGQTGWRTGSVDLSPYSNRMVEVTLLFSAVDAGDSIYDTHVLIDNLRFSTLWIDAKILAQSDGTNQRRTPDDVATQVEEAREILSQAGINVRLRDTRVVPDTDLLDIDGSAYPCGLLGRRTCAPVEAIRLMTTQRAAAATDLNVYYVRSRGTATGEAFPPENYDDITIDVNAGILVADGGTGQTLAHEAGHVLLDAGNDHLPGDDTNFMYNWLSSTATVINRTQSANINRAGAPLLVP